MKKKWWNNNHNKKKKKTKRLIVYCWSEYTKTNSLVNFLLFPCFQLLKLAKYSLKKSFKSRDVQDAVIIVSYLTCPVDWEFRKYRLLCRGIRSPKEYPGYDTKQSDSEVPVMLELWGMRSTPSLLLLPGPLWPGMVAPDKALSIG